ncbi:MAG TPA: TIM barrel protein [Planctomycetota bacterium]|nr:TIM barrel protein [Planctomycetota bacterium]
MHEQIDWSNAFADNDAALARAHARRFDHLAEELTARGVNVDRALKQVAAFQVEVPSWGVVVGGTRFGRFPLPGMPTNLGEKLDDIAFMQKLTGAGERVSLHIPWDKPEKPKDLIAGLKRRGLKIGSVNSNTFQDQPGQPHSYRYGSLTHVEKKVRDQAIAHNRDVIGVGQSLGAKSLSVWIADGGSYPGQIHTRRSFDRYLESLQAIYAAVPKDWTMLVEHKPFEPAFHHSVNNDWGTSYLAATRVGDRCGCLVDFGHHLPGTPIDVVVARLISAGRLGGFHFNDHRYADDDLTAGSVAPYQLFQVFVELTMATLDKAVKNFNPGYTIDQSEGMKDPLEALIQTIDALQVALAQSWIVDYDALFAAQAGNDVLGAERVLQTAFRSDVSALVAEARRRKGCAIDPLTVFRDSGYRAAVAKVRKLASAGAGNI